MAKGQEVFEGIALTAFAEGVLESVDQHELNKLRPVMTIHSGIIIMSWNGAHEVEGCRTITAYDANRK